jgi:hypothetical protein
MKKNFDCRQVGEIQLVELKKISVLKPGCHLHKSAHKSARNYALARALVMVA